MSSKPKPYATPFSNTTTNTFDWKSMSDSDPNVQAYKGINLSVDPGVQRRTDLAEQGMHNRWNSAFNAALPQEYRMQQQEADRREIQTQGAQDAQQAQYAKNILEMQRAGSLLPQLVQTGGTSQGYNTQLVQQQSPWASLGMGALSLIPKF